MEDRDQKIYTAISHFLSMVFHPLLVPSIIFFIIVHFAPMVVNPLSEEGRNFLIYFVVLTTFVLPLSLIILYFLLTGKKVTLNSLEMGNHKARVIPLAITTIVYGVTTYMSITALRLNQIIIIIMIGVTAIIFIVGIISSFYKISAHATGISGGIGFLIAVSNLYAGDLLFYPIVVLIFFAGLLLSARIYLNAHTPLQVFWGTVLGFGTCFGLIMVFFNQ